jgi:hypothetical protein
MRLVFDQKLILSCSFSCDAIHNNQSNQTLQYFLSPTHMPNKPVYEAGLLNAIFCLAAPLGVTQFITIITMHLVTLLLSYFSLTWLCNKSAFKLIHSLKNVE